MKKLKWVLILLFLFFPLSARGDFEPGGGSGDMLKANNLSDVASAAVARTNLGLAKGSDVQTFSTNLATLALGNSAAGRTLLGLSLGSDVQAYSTFLNYMSALTATPANGVLGINATANGVEVKNSLTVAVLDMTSATSAIPQPLATFANRPTTCTIGMKWQDSGTGADYSCTATNTWTRMIPATGIGSDVQAFSSNLATFALGNTSAGRTLLGVAIGSDVQAYSADLVTLTGAQTLTSKILTAPQIQGQETSLTVATTLVAGLMYGGRFSNWGMATDSIATLPTADSGMDGLFNIATTTATFAVEGAAGSLIYTGGTLATTGVKMVSPAIGDYFVIFSFKTGTSTWKWIAKAGQGTLTAY